MKPGAVLSHYRIVSLLGAGGMGEVYRADDTRLKRPVAIKILTPALSGDADARDRLIVEAQAASSLDHPNICTIHEIDETDDGRVFLVMASYDGETLARRIDHSLLPMAEAVNILVQLTRGIVAAHEAGVVHRDIKPANVFLCARPHDDPARVKLLDFGIAKLADRTGLTRTGTTVGTVAYMAPEHMAGHAIDHRADIWSIGVVAHEVVSGQRPFDGSNVLALMKAIADHEPAPLSAVRPDAPPALDAIVRRALAKRQEDRHQSARELLADLEAVRLSLLGATQTVSVAAPVAARSPRRWLLAGVSTLIVVAAAGWFWAQRLRATEISDTVRDLQSLVDHEEPSAALRRLYLLPKHVAADPAVVAAARDKFLPLRILTEPAGASVSIKGYDEPDADWIPLGASPIETRGLITAFRWRITAPGYDTFEGSGPPIGAGEITLRLSPTGSVPAGMVRVPGGPLRGGGRLPEFFIDRYEVTNKAFKAFVDAGGYRNASYWPQPFVKDGRTLTWTDAMAEFRDATGRPGPSTWELGTYPDGQDDLPVAGVSWYEASAYARFAGRALPTVFHWRAAALQSIHSQILVVSNFGGKGTVRVGSLPSLGAFGTYDMAGNVKEWCENEVDGKRYSLGGGFNEPNYVYRSADARVPFDRSGNLGLRLILTPDAAAVPAAAHAAVPSIYRDYSRERPASDELFFAFKRMYAYDAADLAAKIESTEETDAWRVERVSYTAAYNGVRIPAYLFLPKNARPPYQTVVYFPHSGGLVLDSFQQAEMAYLGFLVKSGRALLFPMYQGTYERRLRTPLSGPNAGRDVTMQQVKDVSRSIDYLRSRPDIAADRIAYFGVSLGAGRAALVLGVEPRFRTAILWSGGLPTVSAPPEVDPINFAPRVTTPVLMLNGRDDFTFPVEESQEPLYRSFGTPAADKARATYPGGHVFPFSRMIKDSLDWLDRYLGVPN
jgi:eukaryotic-like serine/threonine-protein kinase